jgi:hypothetical protein
VLAARARAAETLEIEPIARTDRMAAAQRMAVGERSQGLETAALPALA